MNSPPPRLHGGSDALGVPRFDFSTNSNACGPCPQALAAVQQADATRYPDPRYTVLCAHLADFHGVEPGRILVAGSASEYIFRITAWAARRGGTRVCVPPHAFGDYAQAARAWGLEVEHDVPDADLVWCCEPSSPLGGAHSPWPDAGTATVVLDCAYVPLRLSGVSSWSDAQRNRVWQLFSPNKALDLTGVRGAYAIAPEAAQTDVQALEALEALAPSWPLGAHGVALLQSWVQPGVQAWLEQSRITLRQWKARQLERLGLRGWNCLPSETNFFCAQPPLPQDIAMAMPQWLDALRTQHGIKLRDATSFGLPGWVRLAVREPAAQDALISSHNLFL
ncbi:MAG: aminotransferase class I/II-fold pyridoxal phosphate-dependent enzyme [Rhodoferax sp.]|nr:aminotransferase class I/II-fold pyridoxal phosphate-dependent enzyme [Rhodoferax sp.]